MKSSSAGGSDVQSRGSGRDSTVFFGLDSVLDFPLAYRVQWVLKGLEDPQALFSRLAAMEKRALNRGELRRYRVTFADNHDSFWQGGGRMAASSRLPSSTMKRWSSGRSSAPASNADHGVVRLMSAGL